MPTNPIIIQPEQEDNIKKLDLFPNPIDAQEVSKDISANAIRGFFPNFSQLAGTPTVIDANSLGILIQGSGFGQVKQFIAQTAIKFNEGLQKGPINPTKESAYGIPMREGYQQYFETDRAQLPNTNNLIGQYVFDRVQFVDNTSVTYGIDDKGQLKVISKIDLPDLVLNACIVSIQANRYVNQSIPINSDAGTIKEIMAFGEYNIKITGHLINDDKPKEYAAFAALTLDALSKMTTAINIESGFLNIFNINKVVITDYNLQQIEGFSGILTYDISMISETIPTYVDPNTSSIGSTTNFKNPNI